MPRSMLGALILAASVVCARGQDRPSPPPSAGALPGDPVVLVTIPDGRALWDSPAGEALRVLLTLPDPSQGQDRLRDALAATSGGSLESLAGVLGAGELQLGVYGRSPDDAEGEGRGPRRLLVVGQVADAAGLAAAADAARALIGAAGRGRPRTSPHRGVDLTRLGRLLAFAVSGDRFVVGTDAALVETEIDGWLDGAAGLAADSEAVGAAGAATGLPRPLVRIEFDPSTIAAESSRLMAPSSRLLGKRLANPLANLLFGGLAGQQGRVTGALDADADGLRLTLRLPGASGAAEPTWFPPAEETPFDVPVSEETIAVLGLRRDLGDWWRRRETLLSEESQARLAKLDETVGVLFAGGSPAEDVFGRLEPELALVVDRQRFADAQPGEVPAARLPGVCLVARVRDMPSFAPVVQVAFQTLFGVANTRRVQDHAAPFLLDVHEHEGVEVRSARLLPGSGSGGGDEPPDTDFNASPALAIVGDTLLVGTSCEQVRRLVSSLHAGRTQACAGNTDLSLDGDALSRALSDDLAPLAARMILEQGLDADEADARAASLPAAARRLGRARATLSRQPDGLSLELRLSLRPGEAR